MPARETVLTKQTLHTVGTPVLKVVIKTNGYNMCTLRFTVKKHTHVYTCKAEKERSVSGYSLDKHVLVRPTMQREGVSLQGGQGDSAGLHLETKTVK